MEDKVFVDTNILVYARDSSEPDKQKISIEWLKRLWEKRTGCLSTQVCNEYYVTVTRKLVPGMSPEAAWEDVKSLFTWKPMQIDTALLIRAREIQNSYGFSWWDSQIAASALMSNADILLTEDLQHGQIIETVLVQNPFIS